MNLEYAVDMPTTANQFNIEYKPKDSYIPLNYIKQQHAKHLLEFFENQFGLQGYESLTDPAK